MSKEFVQLDLTGVTTELPYRDYYKGRNGLVAKYIADYLGVPYSGEMLGGVEGNVYYVPPVTQERKSLIADVIKSEEDFYGLIVDDFNHVGKSILHKSVSSKVPGFYSFEFAKSVEDLVVPGVTVFSKENTEYGYTTVKGVGDFDIRLKLSDRSDGHGQFLLKNIEEVRNVFESLEDKYVNDKGLVLEANVKEAKTISIGFTVLGSDTFSFLAIQKNDIAPEDGRDRYMGANVRVVRGGMNNLKKIAENPDEQKAIEVVGQFYKKYKSFNPIASRLSFDFLYGLDNKGNTLSGVTDITGRLGGTCPALVLAATEFKQNPYLSTVKSEVSLNYETENELSSERDAVRFIDLPSLRLTAKVNSKY